MNIYATPSQSKSPKNCLDTAEKAKKKKYRDACLKQSQHFTPFVVSVDVLIGVEAKAALKLVASRLMTK